jgi:hypothetical protein
VKREIFLDYQFYASPPARDIPEFFVERFNFAGMCQVATARRFPAGQIHWVVSGLPRSMILKAPPKVIPGLLHFVATRTRGLAPMFFVHMGWRRKSRLALLESEHYKAYFRMAKAMRLQPGIKGIFGASWFHSPDTYTVSPHLAWLNRIFHEEGGKVAIIGPAHPTGGVFQGGIERKRLYDEGKFKPTTGLFIWPRDAVLRWAAAHPELGE